MELVLVAGSSWAIPFDLWGIIWSVLAFVVGPILVVYVWAVGRRTLLWLVLPVPLLIGFVILGVASSCNSLTLYSGSGCNRTAAVLEGWTAIAIGVSAFALAAVMALRSQSRT